VANPIAREDDRLTGATAAAMRVAKTFQSGQNGTKGLALEFGRRLVCVRHRYDDANATRVTTVELVVDTAPLRGPPHLREPSAKRGPSRTSGSPRTNEDCAVASSLAVAAGCRNTGCGRCRVGSSHAWACKTGWSVGTLPGRRQPARSANSASVRDQQYLPR